MPKNRAAIFTVLIFIFLIIYHPVFTTNYFFSDDIHQLWYNKYTSAYPASASQGRWISGLIFDVCFSRVSSIHQLQYLHIFSLAGWILLVLLWPFILAKWAKLTNTGVWPVVLINVFTVCCIPVAIYIGWVSCIEMFIGIGAGILSGHLFFISVAEKSRQAFIAIILSVLTGLFSLCTYQNSFGAFLLPFFIYYLQKQKLHPGKIVIPGLLMYCSLAILYFLIFKFYSTAVRLPHNDRVSISTNIPGKLSFLFSDPLPMAFSVNLLYSARSLFSQIFAPFMMTLWALSFFIRYKRDKMYTVCVRIIIILVMLVLMYLPSMLVSENFASYRTLFVFNLAVFYLLIDQLFFFLKNERLKKLAVYIIGVFLIITGYYNFNFQFVNPLKDEYDAFSGFMKKNLAPGLQTVYFIRADRFMFSRYFPVLPYKDEFGLPSTNKDWVPEPLVKQYLFESTGNRNEGEKIKVVQFADSTEYSNAKIQLSKNDLLIDMNSIFHNYKNERN